MEECHQCSLCSINQNYEVPGAHDSRTVKPLYVRMLHRLSCGSGTCCCLPSLSHCLPCLMSTPAVLVCEPRIQNVHITSLEQTIAQVNISNSTACYLKTVATCPLCNSLFIHSGCVIFSTQIIAMSNTSVSWAVVSHTKPRVGWCRPILRWMCRLMN